MLANDVYKNVQNESEVIEPRIFVISSGYIEWKYADFCRKVVSGFIGSMKKKTH
jgi:hypothetical protein